VISYPPSEGTVPDGPGQFTNVIPVPLAVDTGPRNPNALSSAVELKSLKHEQTNEREENWRESSEIRYI
jgi:hypothetical protein